MRKAIPDDTAFILLVAAAITARWIAASTRLTPSGTIAFHVFSKPSRGGIVTDLTRAKTWPPPAVPDYRLRKRNPACFAVIVAPSSCTRSIRLMLVTA